MRPMVLEFPDDPAVRAPGPAVHARPGPAGRARCSAPTARSRYYVPAGTWTHLLDRRARSPARRWVTEKHGFDSLPLLVRPGAVHPVRRP